MTKITLLIFLISIITTNILGQQCELCKKEFDKLLNFEKIEKVSTTDLENAWLITKKLYDQEYTDYIDSIKNNTLYVSHSLTKVFADICIKAEEASGVDYYFKYLSLTNGSAEEEISFSFERLFVAYPEIVLNRIGNNNEFLDNLAWGFINNKYYGAKNPFDDMGYTSVVIVGDSQTPILNKENCKSIFFETNPSIRTKYNTYKHQIDYILKKAIENLE